MLNKNPKYLLVCELKKNTNSSIVRVIYEAQLNSSKKKKRFYKEANQTQLKNVRNSH